MRKVRPRERRTTGPAAAVFEDAVERVAANVRRLRARAGYTQEALAERADLSTVGVALIEGGKTNVTIATLCQLAYALEVDVVVFLRASRTATERHKALPAR